MPRRQYALVRFAMMIILATAAYAQSTENGRTLSVEHLQLRSVKADATSYKGRSAVRLIDLGSPDLGDAGRLAILRGSSFTDGTIEVDLSGDTAPDAAENLRGFVGIAFRVASDASRFECFYLRPKIDVLRIKSSGITQLSTSRSQAFLGRNFAVKRRASMSRMLIWCREIGRK